MAIIKPDHNSLNMDDISKDLKYVRNHIAKLDIDKRENNDIRKPVKKEYQSLIQKADDTDLVAGTVSERIAIAVSEKDRETVRNAQHFDGHTWEEILSKEEGASLSKLADLMAKNFSNEITSVRDELYQLRAELAKGGVVRNIHPHFGHTDIFRPGFIQHMNESIGTPVADPVDRYTLQLPVSTVSELDEGDYIAIYYRDAEASEVRQIKSIGADGETITLDEAMSDTYTASADNIVIYKSLGIMKDGAFLLARDTSMKLGEKEMWSGLDDDTAYTFRKKISATEQGYAYSFRIPETKRGYLTKLQIQARAYGIPALSCCVIDAEDIGYFKNPEQAEALYLRGDTRSDGEPKMHFFAKSAPVTLDPSLGQTVYTFDFWDSSTGTYPLVFREDTLDYRVRYVAIITATFADSGNYAELMFLQDSSTSGDLEGNNVVYQVSLKNETSTEAALETNTSLNNADMYYGVALREVLKTSVDPSAQGLYTATVRSPVPEGVARARLTLRIKREGGIWNANVDTAGICGVTTSNVSFPVECTPAGALRSVATMGLDAKIRRPMELRQDPSDLYQMPDVIVGAFLTKGTGSGTAITTETPVLVNPGDRVYRNAYIVSAKGKRYVFDSEQNRYILEEEKKIYLNPIAVVPDGDKSNDYPYSDRIIFEGDFTDDEGNLVFFNEIELQIYWENSNLSDAASIKEQQMGVIRDLVFSTDRIAK